MLYSPPAIRRRRRRRVLIVLALVTIVALVAFIVMRLQSDEQQLGAYMETAREVADVYDGIAADFSTLVLSLEETDRPTIVRNLEEAVREAGEADAMLLAAAPPPAAGVANGYAVAASSAWRDGLNELHAAMLILMDEPDSPQGQALLGEALLDLEVGDRAFSRFLIAVDDLEREEEIVTRVTTGVAFVARQEDAPLDATILAGRIREIRALSARHDMAVSDVRLTPEPAGDREGIPVVPASPTFGVQVTVTNRGNEPEENVVVNLLLIQTDANLPPFADARTVAALGPGEATTLTFDRLPVVEGQFHEIVVRAELNGDAEPESNEFRQVFYRNAST